MTIPLQPQVPMIFTVGNVSADTPCRKCGYNLRGLPINGRCPECATPVGVSVNGDLLRYSDPEYVAKLQRGVTLILWGILAIIVCTIGAGALGAALGPAAVAVIPIIILLANLPQIIGAWLLTSPDPSGIGEDRYGKSRKIIRVALIVGLANSLLDFGANAGHVPPPVFYTIKTIAFIAALIGLVGQFAQLNYLEKLALRIPDGDLSQRAHFLMWAIGITYGLLLIFLFAAVLLVRAGGGGVGVACVAGLVALALIVFGVMYLFMLGRLSSRFGEQAALARQLWSGAARTTTPPRSPQV